LEQRLGMTGGNIFHGGLAWPFADDFFVSRKLYQNVDFYTGLIYRAMGFPIRMFTVMFALGRLPGWIAQWREMMDDPETKLGRPRQIYVGHTERAVPALADRR
jgi:citrate synthase